MTSLVRSGYNAVCRYAEQNLLTTPERKTAGRVLAGACVVGAAAFSALYMGNPFIPDSYKQRFGHACGLYVWKAIEQLPLSLQPANTALVVQRLAQNQDSCLVAAGSLFGRLVLGSITMITIPLFFMRKAVDFDKLLGDPVDGEALKILKQIQAHIKAGKDGTSSEIRELAARLKQVAPDLFEELTKKQKTE